MKTRNQIYQVFISEFGDSTISRLVFMSLSDEELAREFGLKVLRRGYFY